MFIQIGDKRINTDDISIYEKVGNETRIKMKSGQSFIAPISIGDVDRSFPYSQRPARPPKPRPLSG